MVFGILLILVSVYPLFLITRENVLEKYIYSRYEIEQLIDIRNQSSQPTKARYALANPIEWQNNIIEVSAKDTGVEAPKTIFDKFEKETNHIVNIIVRINGKEISSPTEAWLRQSISKDSDYLSWLNIV